MANRAKATLLSPVLAMLLLWCGSPAAVAAKPAKRGHVAPPPELALAPALTSGPGVPVGIPPVGLSIEYPVMAAALGTGGCPPPALVAELQRLGSPPLQLAGQSQDFTVPAGSAPAAPQSFEEQTAYPLGGEFWTRLHCLLSATREPLTVGLNARTGQRGWAEQMVAGASAAAMAGLAFSLGNEPDLYYLPDYYALDKPQPGEEALVVNTYLRTAAVLRAAIGSSPLVGPELSGASRWRASMPRVLSTLGVGTFGVHLYPLSVCRTPRAATIGGLLAQSVGNAPSRLSWVVADARAAGAQAIITEANSVSCGGKVGVSDSPASAVWAVRFVLSALRTGFGEVRFHFSGNPYDPFYVRGSEVLRRPLESAMVALNQWLPPGSTFRAVPGLHGLTGTAIAAPGAQPLVLLDNGSAKASTLVLRGALALNAQSFSANGARPTLRPLKGPGHRVQAAIPANTVLALGF
jgi:hypothetical protein